MLQQSLFGEVDDQPRMVNVASVPQRSPFRYPGGKTWFVPRLRDWLRSRPHRPALLVEPFAGGGIVSLTAAFEQLAEAVLMVELDEDVAAVWHALQDGEAEWLAERILAFEMSLENVTDTLARAPTSTREHAFRTILRNRTLHGGILAPGSRFIRRGESGKGIGSRWYPATLAKRLRSIDHIRERLFFEQADALAVLERYRDDPNVVFFIDPPYTAGGKKAGQRLYRHFELDHQALFELCAQLKGDFIMTYDHAEEVKVLARQYGFAAKPIPMKNTHHAPMTELVIGRHLDWMIDIQSIADQSARYGQAPRARSHALENNH
ncbi:MAG: DNA adenine methylase [Chromatiaceae bacterium]|nr:DNA adenine methylase [Chromatiaceae bacterium]